jgi:hypothetical protein
MRESVVILVDLDINKILESTMLVLFMNLFCSNIRCISTFSDIVGSCMAKAPPSPDITLLLEKSELLIVRNEVLIYVKGV